MGSKIKRSLFKYLIISLTISIILSIAVQDAAQNISDNIQLKYTDSSKLYEYQNGYSQLFGDVPQIPDVSPEIMTPSDRIAKELCDFISSWCILFFTLFGVFLSLTLFYKRRLKTPFSVLNEAADKISRQDLDFKISYVYDDELGQICAAFEKMREKLAENNSSMWNMIDEQKQMRSAFSHDLRTPLAVMKGYVEYLLRYYPKHRLSEEKVIEVLGELQSQTERISCFADTMKNINRLDEIIISRAYVSQADLLAKTEAILTVLAQKYAKQFEVHAQKQMDEVLSKGWTVQEIRQFFIDEYGIVGFQSVWNMSAYKKADAGEVQQYLDSVFQEESYTSYLGRKYADYLGITSILFTISVFAILLMRDMRKSIYSFIHTKPISSRNYVLGKYIAGISMVLLFVVILTAIVDVVAVSAGNSYGYKTSLWDIWANIIMYDLPGILLTGCIMLFISILFKNVIPAIPAMLLYFIYANIGTLSSAEDYHYQVKPGAIFIRFPQLFTETEIPSGIVSNQIFLLILAIVLLIASIQIWERRRDT